MGRHLRERVFAREPSAIVLYVWIRSADLAEDPNDGRGTVLAQRRRVESHQ
jgi:hypothetical protein